MTTYYATITEVTQIEIVADNENVAESKLQDYLEEYGQDSGVTQIDHMSECLMGTVSHTPLTTPLGE